MNPLNNLLIEDYKPSQIEGQIRLMPKEIITNIYSCFILAINTNHYAQAFKIGMDFEPKPKDYAFVPLRVVQGYKQRVEDKLSSLRTKLSIVRSPWRDLASFSGTCRHVHRIMRSGVYSNPSIQSEIQHAKLQISRFKSRITVGESKVRVVARDFEPVVIFGQEFSIDGREYPVKAYTCSIQ